MIGREGVVELVEGALWFGGHLLPLQLGFGRILA